MLLRMCRPAVSDRFLPVFLMNAVTDFTDHFFEKIPCKFCFHLPLLTAKQFNHTFVFTRPPHFDSSFDKQMTSDCVYLRFGEYSLFVRQICQHRHNSTYKVNF